MPSLCPNILHTLSAVSLCLCRHRYAGIANLKMRDLESSMMQLWKQHVGADFNVFAALSAAQPVKAIQGEPVALHAPSQLSHALQT